MFRPARGGRCGAHQPALWRTELGFVRHLTNLCGDERFVAVRRLRAAGTASGALRGRAVLPLEAPLTRCPTFFYGVRSRSAQIHTAAVGEPQVTRTGPQRAVFRLKADDRDPGAGSEFRCLLDGLAKRCQPLAHGIL